MNSISQTPGRQSTVFGSAMRRSWRLIALLGTLGAAAGIAAGIAIKPNYSSTTQLLVGSPNATVQAVPGFTQAAQSLAASYSRAGTSAQVIRPVARSLNRPVASIAKEVTLTPVPDSNIISVQATGASPGQSVALGSAMSHALIRYVTLSQQSGGLAGILADYRRAAETVARANNSVRQLQLSRTARDAESYVRAEADLSTAQVRAQALSAEYSSALQDDQAAAGIQLLSQPTGAQSNRASNLEKTTVVGLLVGILLGALLAWATFSRSNTLSRRGLPH